MNLKPKLIIVTGLAATGKSWLATEISNSLKVPLFSKDPIKIELLAQLGVRDRAWDIQIGIAAVKQQMCLAIELLGKNVPVILESNYKQEYDAPLLMDVIERTSCECIQIVCGTHGDVLVERYIKRTLSGERPKELNEIGNIEEFRQKLQKGYDEPLSLPGEVISVDTTDFARVDLKSILTKVSDFLGLKGEH